MSGHSKWATTHRQKEATDQKRGMIFTKLARAITLAAKQGGGDPNTNFKLRLATEKAKQANMPKENIERALKRGTGELGGENIEEVTYEALGPENTALIIKVLTDNKNRTVSDIKNILAKFGGKLAGPNSVSWMFNQLGVIRIQNYSKKIDNLETFELELIDAGAENFEQDKNDLIIYTQTNDLQKIKEYLEKQNIEIDSAEIEFIPKKDNLLAVAPASSADGSAEARAKAGKLLEALRDNEDVEEVFTNCR